MKPIFSLLILSFISANPTFGQTETIERAEKSETSINLAWNSENLAEEILDITDPELSGLTASPNPTRGMISVLVPANLIGWTIQIHDMKGRSVGQPIPILNTSQEVTIEGESGLYLLTIVTDIGILTERIVLETY